MEDHMRTEKPNCMGRTDTEKLSQIRLAPYIEIGTLLISKARRAGGNQFRHMMNTMTILIDYGYIDSVLLKASIVHDLIEDLKDFDQNIIKNCDADGEEVLKLVLEVSRQAGETKADFLKRIIVHGSYKAKVLKCADRIANLIELGYVTDSKFIERTCDDSEVFIIPMALQVDYNMYLEILSLLESRQRFLELF